MANDKVVRITLTLTIDQSQELERFLAHWESAGGELEETNPELKWALGRLFVAVQVANSAH